MKRKFIAFSTTMALLLSVLSAANVGAFTATIDAPNNTPSRGEWEFAKKPDLAGEGIIQRNATQQGAFIFKDATGDQRVIAQDALRITKKITREVDLDWFGVTADANNVYFVAKVDTYNGIQNDPALELIITVDTNHGSGAGNLMLPNTVPFSATKVSADAAWEFAIDAKFLPGLPTDKGYVTTAPKITTSPSNSGVTCNTCAAQLASGAVNAGSFAEIKVPWSQIGGRVTGANFLRFTVATMYSNHESAPDGYNSPVIDVLGIGSTLADIQDGTLATSFDVHFDTDRGTFEPYAPLQVTEFQADTTGKDDPTAASNLDSEWIEIYNPNSFTITDLNNYKVGNAAKRGSGEGMFAFKATSIPAKGVVLVARSKAKFLAAHPGYVGTVYDLTTDMTKYSAWASGDTIDLANGPTANGTFEDQVLILDAKDGIVDMATYGNPTTPYPGHTPFPVTTTTPETSYERCPASRDTNNSAVDFSFHNQFADETPGVICVGVPGIDLTIAKTGPSNPLKDDITQARFVPYTIIYSNIGTITETGTIVVSDTLPIGLSFTNTSANASPQPTSVNGQVLTWSFPAGLGAAPALSSGTIELTVTVDVNVGPNAPLTNNVSISGPNEQADMTNNNTASWTTITSGPVDTSVSSNLSGAVPPGAQFQFTITYRNIGQNDTEEVNIITDVLPAGVTILSEDSPDATWNNATTGTVTWDVGTLSANSVGTIVVTARLASATAGGTTLSNALSITVPANDPTPGDNTETKTLTVGLRKLYLAAILK